MNYKSAWMIHDKYPESINGWSDALEIEKGLEGNGKKTMEKTSIVKNGSFDLETYYQSAFSGEFVDNTGILQYIKSFKHVILWGASFQGKAIGKRLLEEGVNIDYYWDVRYKELGTVNGLNIVEPFTANDPENTLIIVCIGNRVIVGRLMDNLKNDGFPYIIPGDYLYMGMLCPFDKKTGINARRCTGTMECRQIYCHRLGNIIKEKSNNAADPIHLTSITLIVNQICSLKCKYCTSYMNEYPIAKRDNFPLERICKDIDAFFDAIDTVGTITVMGGEPFMHPDISKIIEHLCTKQNFGLISISTSGTYPIKQEQLKGMHDKRVNISFSNYTHSINEKQRNLFYENIDIVKNSGVCYTIGLFSPEWIKPSTLYPLGITNKEKVAKKNGCDHWNQIKNGKVHPCDLANAVYSLGIADYDTDYVDLTENITVEEMRERLRNYLNRPFYETCGHHESSTEMRAMAAEQGYVDFKKQQYD